MVTSYRQQSTPPAPSNLRGGVRYTGALVIPSSFRYDGITYSVTSIGFYFAISWTGLTKVDKSLQRLTEEREGKEQGSDLI